MNPANYSVIRYVPDPARNEALNVGIIVWNGAGHRLKIDEKAAERVVRENPNLATNALLYLETLIAEKLAGLEPFNSTKLQEVQSLIGFPVLLTEARYTTTDDDRVTSIDATLDRLVRRVVTPRRRRGYGPSAVAELEKRLKPYIQQSKVRANHFFANSKTGLGRRVDFYANSSSNVVLDTLQLNLKEMDAIQTKADAEAFKIEDIWAKNQLSQFIVYGSVSDNLEVAEAYSSAARTIQSTGAVFLSDLDEAIARLEGILTCVAAERV